MNIPETITLKKSEIVVAIDVVGLDWYQQKAGMYLGKIYLGLNDDIKEKVLKYISENSGDFSSIIGCCCYITYGYAATINGTRISAEAFSEKVYFDIDGKLTEEDKEEIMPAIN